MSWRILIDTTHKRDPLNVAVFDAVVTQPDDVLSTLAAWAWRLPLKVFCRDLADAALVVEAAPAVDEQTAMSPTDYRLFVVRPHAAPQYVELPGQTVEEWRRDLAALRQEAATS